MASCVRCGRQMPTFTFGKYAEYCSECRKEVQPGGHVSQLVSPWRVSQVTTALIAINVAVFVVMVARGVSPLAPTSLQLLGWGADFGPRTLTGEPWRMLTSAFLHGGIIHLAMNMWCLWQLGRVAEQVYDRTTYLLAYLLCAVGGSLSSLMWKPAIVSVGASGAVFGIAGFLIATFWLAHLPFPPERIQATMRSLLGFAGYNLIIGASIPFINNAAHVGGLFSGLVLGGLLARTVSSKREESRGLRWVLIAGVAVVLALAYQAVQKTQGFSTQQRTGQEAYERGDYDRAITDLSIATQKNPDDVDALITLGNSYLHKKEYAKAEPVLLRVLAVDAHNAYAQNSLGFLYEETNRDADALKIYSAAVRDDAGDDYARFGMARMLDNLGRYPEAIAILKESLRMHPGSTETQLVLSAVYSDAGQYDDAVATLQQVLRAEPDNEAIKKQLDRATAAKAAKHP